jgi:hypothetical protein
MGVETCAVTEGLHHLPHHRVIGLADLEQDAARLGPGLGQVQGQVVVHDLNFVLCHADQLAAQSDHGATFPPYAKD